MYWRAGAPEWLGSKLQSTACVRRQRELKDRPFGRVRCCPHSTPVGFYDRTANRQSHAHAARLGRVERVEEVLESRRAQSRARICESDEDVARTIVGGTDQQLAQFFSHFVHRFDSVHDYIEQNLLQLDAIPPNEWQALRQLGLQRDAIS